jgi:predicted RNA-binding protein YlxR (DUF448 family)
VACRTVRPKRELVRVVRAPDGTIALDESGRAPGRGAYVCRETACMARALEKGGLGRALSTRLPPDIDAALRAAMETTHPMTTTTLNTDQGGARGQE